MTTPQLRLERRTTGVYPYLFHAGPYFWPITPEAVAEIKRHDNAPPSEFAARLIDAVGVTRYLRHQLDEVLARLDDRDAQLRAVQAAVAAL